MIWRPIPAPPPNGTELSGAPYDGELVDLWCIVSWRAKLHIRGAEWEISSHRVADAWWETTGDPGWYVHVPTSREPVRVEGATHWMPIPPGPRTSRCEVVWRWLTADWFYSFFDIFFIPIVAIFAVACVAVLLGGWIRAP